MQDPASHDTAAYVNIDQNLWEAVSALSNHDEHRFDEDTASDSGCKPFRVNYGSDHHLIILSHCGVPTRMRCTSCDGMRPACRQGSGGS